MFRMERACVDQDRGHQNSHDPRPRATTGRTGPTTNGHTIALPPALTPDLEPTPPRANTPPGPSKPASAYINTLSSSPTWPSPSCSSSATSVLDSRQLPSVSRPSSDIWSSIPPTHSQPTPALPVQYATASPRRASLSTPSKSSTFPLATMSTAALQFDPGFNHFSMGGRSSFAWPDVVLESSHNTHYGQDLGPYSSEASLSPPSHSRSMTSSPPRMTPEQRELKRQRDQARRDSKLAARLHRSSSHSSQSGQYDVASPPHSINGDYTSTTGLSHMPIYTTAPADISLLTEPTTLAPQLVLPPYSPPLPTSTSLPLHSPPLPSSTSTVFPSPYQPHSYLPEYPYTPSTSASMSPHYGHIAHEPPMMYSMPPVMHNGGMPQHGDGPSAVRVVQSRPKPQCWEHGCNGRQFSTFSNLLRHQREKSGQASKASCPDCGAEFTRTTARNGHLLHQKCKTKRQGSMSSN